MAEITLTATTGETGYLVALPSATWADVWGHIGSGGYESQFSYEAYSYISSGKYNLSRGRIMFDTSALAPPVSSATLRIAFKRLVAEYGTRYLHFVGAVGCGDNMANTDFGALKNNVTDISDSKYSVGTTFDTYFEFALNAYGLSLINTSGYTIFGMRFEDDINNVAPVDDVSEVWTTWYGGVYSAGPSGFEAQLVVDDASNLITDRVTGIVIRHGPGYFDDELHLGGLSTTWRLVDLQRSPTPANPSIAAETTQAPGVISGPWFMPEFNNPEGGYYFMIVNGKEVRWEDWEAGNY